MTLTFAFPGVRHATSIGFSSILIAMIISTLWAQSPSPSVYTIDATRSRLEIAVFRGGLLKLAGHDHTIAARNFSGEVHFNPAKIEDSSVRLNVETESMVVVDDPEVQEKDRKEVQKTMRGEEVLNVKAFPAILFLSTGVSHITKPGENFTLTGKLKLHGVEKEIAFPVHIHAENDELQATGTVAIKQTDFGMKPVKAALGTIRVKDQISVTFDFLARRKQP
jgi:polyisoprenoid-binding protein YceI